MARGIKIQFAKQLQTLRIKEGLSIPELAKRSGISRQHIRDLEMTIPQKRATIETLEKLAKGLKLPVWKLLQFKD